MVPEAMVYMYDPAFLHTFDNPNIHYFQSYFTRELCIEYSDRNSYLKMDIEQAEYGVLQGVSGLQYCGLTIEWHGHGTAFNRMGEFMKLAEELTHDYVLYHIHANNAGGTCEHDGYDLPETFECSYIRRDLVPGSLQHDFGKWPTEYDSPTAAHKPDIELKWMDK